ncbi:hypothetical protein GbCGDNIH2_7017 [Granulibacter bethesdensis]|nr:hypothetical protein GbCGDNIH2_7017 [Granulibacter bethesdensis]
MSDAPANTTATTKKNGVIAFMQIFFVSAARKYLTDYTETDCIDE